MHRLEVKGPRELGFSPGIARGPIYPGFKYESEAGAHAGLIAFKQPGQHQPETLGHKCRDYTNGGPAFMPHASDNSTFRIGTSRYSSSANVDRADSSMNAGSSGAAANSATDEPSVSQSACADQPAQSDLQPSDARQAAYEILAVYPEKGNAIAAVACRVGRGIAVLVGTHPELDPKWLPG